MSMDIQSAALHDTPPPGLREGIDFSITPARSSGEAVGVTVIIPTFQAEATLSRAVQSALGQTMRDIEVIVADDGSTDASWRLIADWLPGDPRLRALRNKRNRGKSAVMNCAIAFARGRWLAVLDADDWYHPDRLAALATLGETSKADMVADNQFIYDAVAATVVGPAWPIGGIDWELTFDDYLLGSNVYDVFNLGMLKPLVRTEFVRARHLSYDESARIGEDFLYLFELFLRGGRAAICDTPYYFYTQPFGTISRRWADPARRRYDFQSACDINQRYLRTNTTILTPHQSRHLTARSRRFESLELYFRAKELFDRREWRGLLGRLICNPTILDCAMRRLFGRYVTRSAAARIAHESRGRSAHGLGQPAI
jgi:succinoglycan biosynthesis protein ExoO